MTSSQQALASPLSTTLDTVQEILGALVARHRTDEVLTSLRQIPAREAEFRPMPGWVRSELSDAYRAKGIKELYSHQAAATAELLHNGKNVVVVTPTASGKTLCYNLPVLNAVLENPDTRALYLFPTKALAQDQLAELHDLAKRLDDSFGVFTYDGDTPNDARKAIRERGHIVLTNPDMLHTGILPHHTKWMRLFENLRYIVLDELHTYRGVFGSHLANVLRRLRRVARFYGSNPQFICCSATIANPGELASQLIESEVDVVEENGAPAGEKLFVFYNPPMVNRNLGIRRSYINEATRVAKELLARKLQTIVFANSRLHTEVLLTYLQQANPPMPGQAEPVRGYRGGYLPGERRALEHELLAALPFTLSERQSGIFGLVYALASMATLLLMCDRRDLGTAVGERPPSAGAGLEWQEFAAATGTEKELFEPNLYLYDAYPGGIGLAPPATAHIFVISAGDSAEAPTNRGLQ